MEKEFTFEDSLKIKSLLAEFYETISSLIDFIDICEPGLVNGLGKLTGESPSILLIKEKKKELLINLRKTRVQCLESYSKLNIISCEIENSVRIEFELFDRALRIIKDTEAFIRQTEDIRILLNLEHMN